MRSELKRKYDKIYRTALMEATLQVMPRTGNGDCQKLCEQTSSNLFHFPLGLRQICRLACLQNKKVRIIIE